MIVRLLSTEALADKPNTYPVIIAYEGVSKFHVGSVKDGKVTPVIVKWTDGALQSLKEKLEKIETLKSFDGHVVSSDGLHRSNMDWIGTLQGPYEIKEIAHNGDKRKGLVGNYLVHEDTDKGKVLLNRIKQVPGEVKFSLDYRAAYKPETEGKRNILRIDRVNFVRSLDWVPESGFDNGVLTPNMMQSIQQSLEKFFRDKEEEDMLNLEDLKTKHPDLYQQAFDAGREEGKRETPATKGGEPSAIENSPQYKELVQSNAQMKAQVEDLQASLDEEKKAHANDRMRMTVLEEHRKAEIATNLQTAILQKYPDVPASLHADLKAMVSWRDFEQNGVFEVGDDSVRLFCEAFELKVKEWAEKLPKPGQNIGLSQGKQDGARSELEVAQERWEADLAG